MLRRLAVLLVLIVIAAACGGDDEPAVEEVASLNDGQAGADQPTERLSFEDAVLGFTQCMRANGVDMPDLQVDAEGQPRIPAAALSDIDTESAEFTSAFVECASILTDAGVVSLQSDPELLGVVQDQLTDFAACMRANGVPDFPDPNPAFDGSGSPFPLSALNPSDPRLVDALDACQDLLAFPTVGE